MKNLLTTLVEELNKYDLEAYVTSVQGTLNFKSFPYLSVRVLDDHIEVSGYLESTKTIITASFTQPLQAIRYILGGVWNEIK